MHAIYGVLERLKITSYVHYVMIQGRYLELMVLQVILDCFTVGFAVNVFHDGNDIELLPNL